MMRICPVLSLRVSGLSPQDLEVLSAPALSMALERVRSLREAAEAAGRQIARHLYDLVPALDGTPDVRRAVLGLRRDVHNARCTPRTAEAARTAMPFLSPGAGALVTRWLGTVCDLASARAELDRCAMQASRAAGSRMLALLRTPDIAATLALASPAFTRELLRADPDRPPAPGSRTARSALAYFTRTATKTSPFGALTTLGTAHLGPPPDRRPAPARHRVDLASPRHLAVHLLRALAACNPTAFPLRDNPSLRRTDRTWRVLLPQYQASERLHYRFDEPATVDGYVPYLDGTWRSWADGTDGQRALIRRWIAAGILLPGTPWRLEDRGCFRQLAGQAAASGHLPAGVAQSLEALARAEDRMPDAGAEERLVLDTTVRQAAQTALRGAGAPVPRWLARTPLFHQNVPCPDRRLLRLPDSVADDLRTLAGLLRPAVRRSGLYDVLVEHFVARYGRGGTCRDVMAFLHALCRRPDYPDVLRRTATVPVDPLPCGTVGAPAVSVLHQLVAEDEAAVHRGDYRMVVNRVIPSAGALLARWGAVPGTGQDLEGPLRAWIEDLYPGCAVYGLWPGGDYTMVQAPPGHLLPAFRWPTELRPDGPDDSIGLADLVLSHDPGTGTLQLYGPGGRNVALPYLGSVIFDLLDGPVKLLATLSNPWLAEAPWHPSGPATGGGATPRATHGRLVLERATWRMPAASVPRPDRGEAPAAFLERFDDWRRAEGLPRLCFVQLQGPGAGASKPQWADLGSPHVLSALQKELEHEHEHEGSVRTVSFTEQLPGPGGHWLTGADGRRRAAELCALVRLDATED
ncbi:hypothetical protein FGW37_00465 [Streptomyces rectiverticillatus]|uniref:lantibiotic dehydratase n=1 Tax=Streptomyces rectiverticillatus TaxID=173860 RepID=UPI0015C36F2D|nr:lantibiotic dehydratase [Streptomyces rectiverticillatus]QLE70287.1 hypothetical protein FGW37_00465 [Streptomyces rectiverticillatus]